MKLPVISRTYFEFNFEIYFVEIANTCAFLASEKSSYITGATIEVTGMLITCL
jgi:NAD(P)-dependent dehydrogenase (short-subunit alcohol dehydrogenase family)